MGSSPSKQKKVVEKEANVGSHTTVDSGQSAHDSELKSTTPGGHKIGHYHSENDRVKPKDDCDDKKLNNDTEKQGVYMKVLDNVSDGRNVTEPVDGSKADREVPWNVDVSNNQQPDSVKEAVGIKPDFRSGQEGNADGSTDSGQPNANGAQLVNLIDIENVDDEFEKISEQTQANYDRTIPTIKWKDIVPNCYKMDHARRGKAIVINNENFMNNPKRKGTFVDYSRICLRLRKLRFDVTGYIDVTCEEITSAFRQIANEDHSDADCFACVILSHGEADSIFGIDAVMKLETIFKMFHANNCPSLAGKPKLFFIQSCRGTGFDDGVDVSVDVTDAQGSFSFPEEEVEYKVPDEADFLISYSTTPGYYSWRNSQKGTWYIQSLVHVLDNYGTVVEIQKLMTRVNKMVSQNFKSSDPNHKNKTQMPSFTSKLTKDLYFIPK